MKYLFILKCILIFSTLGYAQKLSREYGKVTDADYNYQSKDKKAEAVVLHDIGEVSFIRSKDGGFDVLYKKTTRIKILKDEGLSRANVEFLLYKGDNGAKEEVHKLKAKVYNKTDGVPSVTSFDKKNAFTENVNAYYNKYKFTLPQVKVGSVIEYQVSIISPFFFRLPKWSFQDRIPTVHSEFDIKIFPFFEYYFIAQNIKAFTYKNSKKLLAEHNYNGSTYNEMQHVFVMKDVPAFRDESYITSINDYLMKIDFQLGKYYNPITGSSIEVVSTWEKYAKTLMKHEEFGKFVAKAKKESKAIFTEHPELLEGSDTEKAQKIVQYVKDNYVWNGYYGKLSDDNLNTL
ncbi:DUF3857 domain-containing protein [Flammeovirga sp. EKP202]|uniref:DUF3857 domain-containing protein n=1 Tax=Flammeovirga sp. EKP202 TaxID=2770592 RepID=UPI00165FC052|nr:DUF3857 domain-containing protein [Flammeovirga sp. EKP202]MBD0400540.1 DUF3857 domain-containing protein [Flammeovirga sp. EKP202]